MNAQQLDFAAVLTAPNHPPYQRHSDTSRAAADSVAEVTGALRVRVFRAIEASGTHGMTAAELETALHLDGSTVRPRVCELIEMGRVCDSGERRETPSGRKARVLVALP